MKKDYVTRPLKIIMFSAIIFMFITGTILGAFVIKPADAKAESAAAVSNEPKPAQQHEDVQPTPSQQNELPADLKLPVPGLGESLYVGSAVFDEAQKFYMAFVLSADGSEMHGITFYIDGLNVSDPVQGVQMFNMKVTESFNAAFPVSDSLNLGSSHLSDFSVTGETAHAKLNYVYNYYGESTVEIPFGTSDVDFRKITDVPAAAAAPLPSAPTAAEATTADVTFEDKTYTVSIGEIGINENGKTTVEVLSPGMGDTIPIRDGEFVVPVQATIIIGGDSFHWNSVTTGADGYTFEFETDLTPEKIVIYPYGGDEDESVQVVFDAITKTLLTD